MQRDWLTLFIVAGAAFVAGTIHGGMKALRGVEKLERDKADAG